MVRLPIPKLVDRGLAENGPVRLEPAPEQVGFVHASKTSSGEASIRRGTVIRRRGWSGSFRQ